jgi:hypothetical protein
MKNTLIFIALAALVFNIYDLGIWLSASFSTGSHAEAVTKYLNYFPASFSPTAIHWTSFIITVLSIAVFAYYKGFRNHKPFTACIIMQAAFLLLYTWQSL